MAGKQNKTKRGKAWEAVCSVSSSLRKAPGPGFPSGLHGFLSPGTSEGRASLEASAGCGRSWRSTVSHTQVSPGCLDPETPWPVHPRHLPCDHVSLAFPRCPVDGSFSPLHLEKRGENQQYDPFALSKSFQNKTKQNGYFKGGHKSYVPHLNSLHKPCNSNPLCGWHLGQSHLGARPAGMPQTTFWPGRPGWVPMILKARLQTKCCSLY